MAALPDRPRTIEESLVLGRRTLVIGHRGASGLAPQNTLPAFERAIELGVDMVELDVQLSRDGELVVIHDPDLDATTDGAGPVAAQALDALTRLDAGSWLAPEWTGTRIPTLRQVLERVAREVLVNVEIKTEAVTDAVEPGVESRIAEVVRALGLEERVIVSSFDPRALEHLRQLAPEIATASLYNRSLHRGRSPIEIMDAVGSRAFNLSRRQVRRRAVEHCHRHGRPVGVYTVNEPSEMRMLVEMGVDALFTDRPDLLIDVLASA
ncbi:MAG TPA: glycerophosphodiester phosphodiesterase family protein [Thermoanaerobaculia bacterium]|nr:glycerophosphodiester phosphodiesterase family protein [Thermoanaerobaculia bacterium]